MKTIAQSLPTIAAVGGSLLGFLLGGFDGYLYSLLGFVVIDYLTGLALAAARRQVSSQIGFTGILKKMLIFVIVAMGHLLDQNLQLADRAGRYRHAGQQTRQLRRGRMQGQTGDNQVSQQLSAQAG